MFRNYKNKYFFFAIEFFGFCKFLKNSHLLPADEAATSNGFLPSKHGNLWSPESAISNHTARNVRFQQTNVQTRWTPGQINKFTLEGKKSPTQSIRPFISVR